MDLTFSLAERWTEAGEPAGIGGAVEFRTDVFDADSIEALIERLQRVLVAMTADPTRRLSSIDVLDAGEHARLDAIGNRAVLTQPGSRYRPRCYKEHLIPLTLTLPLPLLAYPRSWVVINRICDVLKKKSTALCRRLLPDPLGCQRPGIMDKRVSCLSESPDYCSINAIKISFSFTAKVTTLREREREREMYGIKIIK